MLLLAVVAGVLSIWVGTLWRSTKARRNAVATIERLGGYVMYEHQFNSEGRPLIIDPVTGVIQPDEAHGLIVSPLDAPRPGPFLIRSLLWHDAFWRVRTINLGGAMSLQDNDMRIFNHLSSVTDVSMVHTPVGDAGVRYMGELTNLRKLWLGTTYVSDEGVRYLRSLPNLEELSLFQTHVTDAAVPDIAAIQSLRYVDVGDSFVTDDGIKAFSEMRPDLKQDEHIGSVFGERQSLR